MRLSYDDFCKMDFEDFTAVHKAFVEQRDADLKDKWERMRLLATITILPHINQKKGKLTPEKLLQLPWDKRRKQEERKAHTLTAAQQRKRMEELVKKLGDEII